MGQVPCVTNECRTPSGWEGPGDTYFDLAGTCPLLADARGAGAELTAQRVALAGARADIDRAATAVRESTETVCAGQDALERATEGGIVARDAATAARSVAAQIRARIRAERLAMVEECMGAVRHTERAAEDAQRVVTEAERAVVASLSAAAIVATKRAAQTRAGEEQQVLDGITSQGEATRDEIALLPAAADAEALRAALAGARRELSAARDLAARLDAVQRAESDVVPARQRVTRAESEECRAQEALDACREDPNLSLVLAHAAAAAAYAAQRLSAARDAATQAVQAVTRAEAEAERLHKAVESRATKRAEVEHLAADANLWTQTADALKIAAVILIERAIPVIEAEANRILQRISARGMRLTLNTQRQNKTTDGLRETLDVIVQDAVGQRPYEDFSGGEKFRINMALRLGLARLLADREGVPVEFLVIDEGGFGALDPEGIGAMKEVVAALQQDFRLVLLITHIPDVADCLPRLLRVRQTGAGSTIEVT